ncbi:hypothetical protein FVEG_15159 [Fusarium verticillioides 7600]|uniref:Uncharacterized protein n=1 Tax=Gibberella moniliformis (strain M3125 / FGSC 7600) TaxID=334819 RepID=W7LMN1_GIBM7|nr:hypothetical protein FVEG_15159 [Fusarium verticillioides 7600]EWG40648.1 hypothetical protein FVEG_15159 [Fusarium verticillioides 7600]
MFTSELSESYPTSQLADHAEFLTINLPLTNHRTNDRIDISVKLILLTGHYQIAIGFMNLRHVSIQSCSSPMLSEFKFGRDSVASENLSVNPITVNQAWSKFKHRIANSLFSFFSHFLACRSHSPVFHGISRIARDRSYICNTL